MDELLINDELTEEPEEEQREIVLASITEITADGVKIILDGDEEAGEKEYKVNAAQRFVTGDRVKIRKNSGTYIVEYVIGKPMQRYPIPPGGSDGQYLAKDGANYYAVKWVTPPTMHEIPNGGSANQMLVKHSATDYDVSWANQPEGLPTGGTAGQMLVKNSATNYDVKWVTPETAHGIPTGGTTGQVLTKTNNTNYSVEWSTPSVSLLKNGSYTLTLNSSGQLVPNSSGSVSIGASNTPIGNLYTNGNVQLGISSYNAKLGFFGTNPIAKINSITTSSSLANLIQALKNYGLF